MLSGIIVLTTIFLLGFTPENRVRSPRKIMNTYRGEKGFVSFSVPMFLIKPFIKEEDQEVKDLLRDIRKIRILVCENAALNPRAINNCMQDFAGFFRDSYYTDLLTVTDNDETVIIKAIPGNNCMHDIILIASDDQEFIVVHLLGSLDMDKFRELVRDEKTCSAAI